MILKSLLVSCFILASLPKTTCNYSGRKETVEETPKLILSSSTECARECTTDGKPKICYYHFTLELYPVLGEACDFCTPNSTNAISSSCQCITANGVQRIMLAVNRMLPGPTIYVCLGDKVIVDVENKMNGLETTIHWHGLFQNRTPWNDGVPLITQCPISSGNTFRYQFIADNAGTHFWHTHMPLQKPDGLYGAFIVRAPPGKDPNSGLYKRDLPENIIVLSDWRNTQDTERFPTAVEIPRNQHPQSLLINGKGQWTDPDRGNKTTSPSEVFKVSSGIAYRFRMINAFFSVCPAEITIEGHTMTMIATDGAPIKPKNVTTIISLSGERYDFVINADKRRGAYWIQVRALGECVSEKIQQTAILRYSGASIKPNSVEPTYDRPLRHGVVFNPFNGNCTITRNDTLCITDLESAIPVDRDILKAKPDVKFVIPFNFVEYTPDELYKPNTYKPFLRVSDQSPNLVATVGGISFKFPPSPPLSQFHDMSPDTFCSADNPPADCGTVCMCTNTYEITMNSIVEVTLVNTMNLTDLIHPFHLHGYDFKVINMGYLNVEKITAETLTAEYIQKYGSKFSPKKNVKLPPSKDTISVPSYGYATIRFHAKNPGWWLLHCHFPHHEAVGMVAVMHVGNSSDLPPRPPNFPVCGNFKPSITPSKT